MSFLYPAFLLGGLAIAIPIALHLLRRDVAPEVPFTAVRLLHRSPVERADRRRRAGFAAARLRSTWRLEEIALEVTRGRCGAFPPPLWGRSKEGSRRQTTLAWGIFDNLTGRRDPPPLPAPT